MGRLVGIASTKEPPSSRKRRCEGSEFAPQGPIPSRCNLVAKARRSAVTKPALDQYRHQLRGLAERLQADVADLGEEAFRKAGGEASGNLSNTPLHPADLGTDAFDQEVTMTLLRSETHTLREVGAAMTRIAAGVFGRCEACGRLIPPARLRAVPYARHCIGCAREAEQAARGRTAQA